MSQDSHEKKNQEELKNRALRFALAAGIAAYLILPYVNRFIRQTDLIFYALAVAGITYLAVRYQWIERMQQQAAVMDEFGERVSSSQASEQPAEIPRPQAETKQPPVTPPPEPADAPGVVYAISVPKDTQWRPELAHALICELAIVGDLALRIVATVQGVQWQIIDLSQPPRETELISSIIRKVYPTADVRAGEMTYPTFTEPFYRLVDFYQPAGEFVLPITYARNLPKVDPLTLIVNDLSKVEAGEQVSFTVYLSKLDETLVKKILKDFEQLATLSKFTAWDTFLLFSPAGWGMLAAKGLSEKPSRYPPEQAAVINGKFTDLPPVLCYVVFEVNSPHEERLKLFDIQPNLFQLSSDFQQIIRSDVPTSFQVMNQRHADHTTTIGQLLKLRTEDYKGIKPNAWKTIGKARIQPLNDPKQCILCPGEIAALWHVPHQEFSASRIVWVKSKQVRVPDEVVSNRDGVCLGDNLYGGKHTPVYLTYPDRTTHLAVFGMTGTGKTNFLHTLIAQDIANGKGVCVVDPMGNLVRNLLRFSIPVAREDDVIVLDVADEDYPPPFNIMSLPTEAGIEAASSRVMSILAKIFPDMPGTRWADTFAMALLTLKAEDSPTIRDVDRVLTDEAYREQLLSRSNNEALYSYWEDDFGRESESMQRELTRPIKRHLRAFFGNPYFYPISCHPQGLDFATLLQGRKIILVSLGVDEAKLTSYERRLLGSLVISQIQMAATGKACQEHGFYLFVDETQEFITTSLPTMLTQARQFNLSLTLANQYLKQLVGDTLEAVRGDVGTFAFFQLGDEDAGIAARYTRPNFEAEELMQLDKYQAAIRMRLGRATLPAFSLTTRLAYDEGGVEGGQQQEARIRARSRQQYTPMSRPEILKWLTQKYPRRQRGKADDENLSDEI